MAKFNPVLGTLEEIFEVLDDISGEDNAKMHYDDDDDIHLYVDDDDEDDIYDVKELKQELLDNDENVEFQCYKKSRKVKCIIRANFSRFTMYINKNLQALRSMPIVMMVGMKSHSTINQEHELINVDLDSFKVYKFVGVAKCHPKDKFDMTIGKKIAYQRARDNYFSMKKQIIMELIKSSELVRSSLIDFMEKIEVSHASEKGRTRAIIEDMIKNGVRGKGNKKKKNNTIADRAKESKGDAKRSIDYVMQNIIDLAKMNNCDKTTLDSSKEYQNLTKDISNLIKKYSHKK